MADEDVRLGIVGLGNWGKFVVRAFGKTAGCRLSRICDADEKLLAQESRQFPNAAATSNYRDILNDEAIDAVAIATPSPAHYEMARWALLSGKHVCVQPPLTLISEHAEELVDLAAANGRKLMVGNLLRHHPAVPMMKREFESGSVGDFQSLYCQHFESGVERPRENALCSLAPDDISVILHLVGQEPDRIVATGRDVLQRGVEDVVFASLTFPDGKMAHIHVSRLDSHDKRSMVLVGSEKTLVFDGLEPSATIRVFNTRESVSPDAGAMPSNPVHHGDIPIPKGDLREPLSIEAEHFIQCIQNDQTPRSDGNDGLRVVRILEAVDLQLRGAIPMTMRKAA